MYYFNSYFSYINSLTFLYNKFTLLQVRLILNFIKIQQKYEREIINNFFFFYSFLNTFFLNFIFYKNNINYLFPLKQNYLISIYSFDLLFYHFIYSFSFIYNSHDK